MGNAEVKPRFGIIISLLFLLLSCVIQLVVVISPNWFEVYCNNGTLILGLWQYCGDPLKALTNNTEDTQAAIIDLFGYKQETETCKTLEGYMFLDQDGSPGMFFWFQIIYSQMLERHLKLNPCSPSEIRHKDEATG